MPRTRDRAQTARWERLKGLTDELARAMLVNTPTTRALAARIRRDIAAVYRAAGLPYPLVLAPMDTDADARRTILAALLEELRLETTALTESATSAIERAQVARGESREAVRRARGSLRDRKR